MHWKGNQQGSQVYDKPGVVVAGVDGFGVVGLGVDGFGVVGRGVEGLGVVAEKWKAQGIPFSILSSGTQDFNIYNGRNMLNLI